MLRYTPFSYSNLSIEQRARLKSLIPASDSPQRSFTPAPGDDYPLCHPTLSVKDAMHARLRAAALDYFIQRDFDGIAVTLTFKPRRSSERFSEQVAEAAVRELIKRLNKFANGRGRPPLQVIAIREGGIGPKYRTHLHYHLKLEVPLGSTPENFAEKVEHYWTKLRWASRDQNRVVPMSDHGWLSYILKTRSKRDYGDSIDWKNTQVPPRPVAECTVGG